MQYLAEKGMIVRRQAMGTHVAQPKVRRPLELTSLYDDLKQDNQEPGDPGPVARSRAGVRRGGRLPQSPPGLLGPVRREAEIRARPARWYCGHLTLMPVSARD